MSLPPNERESVKKAYGSFLKSKKRASRSLLGSNKSDCFITRPLLRRGRVNSLLVISMHYVFKDTRLQGLVHYYFISLRQNNMKCRQRQDAVVPRTRE